MDRGLSVLVSDTADAYRSLHENWTQRVIDYAKKLDRLSCSLVFSNVSYLSLAAAKYLGIPAVALSPLNWADIYKYFCCHAKKYTQTYDQMLTAYQSAKVFLKPTPCMPMHELSNTKEVGPVAAHGNNVKHKLYDRLGLKSSTKMVLVAMGGHDMHLPVTWPKDDSVVWLVSRTWQADQPNVIVFEDFDLPFLDLLASCDLLISKPGYGSFTEATYMRKPILYVTRPDWPEEPFLIHWLHRYNICKQLATGSLYSGTFIEDINELLQRAHFPAQLSPSTPSGLGQTVDIILNSL